MPTAILDEKNIAISEGDITVYNYSSLTGEYVGNENEYLIVGLGIPGNSTIIAPPPEEEGKAITWNGIEWIYIEDHRGETVYTASGNEIIIKELGPYPEGSTTTKPSKPEAELYNEELAALALAYNYDVTVLSESFSKAALIDGVSEVTKKTAIYNEYVSRKSQYQADVANLKAKYGV